MFKIKDIVIKNDIVIAPMAGISNAAFRSLCYEFNAGLVYTEMISDKAIYFGDGKTKEMTEVLEIEHPLSMQIFGSDVDTMVYAAKYLDVNTSCDIIDINMGCPANKIVKGGGGSNLLRTPELAIAIVKAVVNAVSKPVTVKMRIGYDHNNINFLQLAIEFEKLGVAAIALHGRTKTDLYEGKANWEYVKLLKENIKIPVIGNGDIKTLDDYIYYKEYSKCDAIMIGRGVIGNPYLIREITAYHNNIEYVKPTFSQKFDMCIEHTKKLIKLKGERIAIKQMRGIVPWYLAGLPYCTSVKNKCSKINTLENLVDILDEYKKNLTEYYDSYISRDNI